ncbi:SusC/RagA family TonB-linked outer membrane protein [Flavobacterium sp. PLA-1-15]|uniref:SusC/RagA family TonB-linked outer membrane protein n=1 Tax=Flavobacterium sp. PLA-1-15 TaxID=3380533 RepID=UPI003B7F2AF7
MYAQGGTNITGVVTDASDSMSIPGVTVMEKGTTNGTSTDIDGSFSLRVAGPNAVIVISSMGYQTQEIPLNGKQTLTVVMAADEKTLEEVVVVGYGTVKKRDLTGTVSTISAKDVTERNTTSALEAIQGNVAGVQISSNSGRLGDGFNITIRGKNSILLDSKPLFIVDGAPVDDISFLNPQDIERMDVLKDASSAAIYGSRGASGVVIITTKSGSASKSGFNVNFESSFGTKEVARLPKMMNGDKWFYYHQSAFLATVNGGNYTTTTPEQIQGAVGNAANPVFMERVNSGKTFDWYDAVLQNGIQQNNYLNITGRSEGGMSYNLGLGVQNETGTIENESLDKYTLKAGLNHKVSDKFSTGVNLTVVKTDEQLGSDVAMRDAFRLNPFLSPWKIDADGNEIVGDLAPVPGKLFYPNGTAATDKTSTYNPLLEIANTSDQIKRWRAIGNVYFQYDPYEWLSFRTSYSGNFNTSKRGKYWGALTNTGVANATGGNPQLPSSSLVNTDGYDQTWDNQVNVNFQNENHAFSFLGLQSININTFETSELNSRLQPFDTGFHNIGSGPQSTFNVNSTYTKRTLNSYAARLNYTFKDKYLLTASIRWDGSSVLAEGNKWESFPSAAFAWKLDQENFLKDSKVVSVLKPRVSFGYTGNSNVQPYTTLNGLNSQLYYDFNATTANGFVPATLANKELTWEKTRELNVGLDFGFFNNRISGTIDVYDRLSKDLLYEQRMPLESGWPRIYSNVGSVSNKGVEVGLTTKNIVGEKVSWSTTFVFSKNTNKLESIYGQSDVSDVGNNLHLGQSLNSYYNYVFDGVWQESERAEAATYNQTPGQARVKDLNGDGAIDAVNDRQVIGNSDPDWTGSVNSTLTVGDFDFSFSVFTSQGAMAYSPFHENFLDLQDRGRQRLDIANWYIPENSAGIPAQASNTYPMPRNEGAFWNTAGNAQGQKMGMYRDASFVKVKNISVGYTFNKELTERLKIKKLRIYANVLNPFVFTDYDGYDPEWATAPFSTGRVSSITYQFGLSLNL